MVFTRTGPRTAQDCVKQVLCGPVRGPSQIFNCLFAQINMLIVEKNDCFMDGSLFVVFSGFDVDMLTLTKRRNFRKATCQQVSDISKR